MSWSIDVKSDNLPNPQERISSVCDCDGNFYTAVMKMKNKQLRLMNTEEAVSSLAELIAELDKGDNGLFSNMWCKESDQKWSQGRETREEFSKWLDIFGNERNIPVAMPFRDYISFCGHTIRERIRTDAFRFWLYYKAGYQITYEW